MSLQYALSFCSFQMVFIVPSSSSRHPHGFAAGTHMGLLLVVISGRLRLDVDIPNGFSWIALLRIVKAIS